MSMRRPIRLLCLPCAGASATMYLGWRRTLPRWIEVVPVELPGRGSRLSEAFAKSFDDLVAQLCDEQAGELHGDFALFGHSMGALLAYGMALRLLDLGAPVPLALVVSGSPAPSRRDPGRFAGKDNDEALLADLRKQGGTPEEVLRDAELIRLTLDVLGADYRVCERFSYAGPRALPMPVHVLGGRDDDIESERLQAWGSEAGRQSTLDWFDGGHFFIRQHEGRVLSTLASRLGESAEGVRHATRVLA
ncbi:Surfactin synthase thioesterase subunit [Paracidovorax anthurii]|uniref:Surfactin synthase thioesterase subunit n=2 Tax=Paracidovorax anthurii TaxID=78229 RepID=A0A328YMK0_9BURK|nr:surfactin synthase thioesterase subunit [Paracidovorax anthurii]